MGRFLGAFICLAVPATLVLEPLPAQQDPGLTRLEREITRLAALAGGRVGVGAVHLPS
ncbi:MAG: hypothetical protein HYV20_08420, partial [Gemmatimonadetes bacterium]|nr:hypothetical protein [Gemmatimonadota bacterium]